MAAAEPASSGQPAPPGQAQGPRPAQLGGPAGGSSRHEKSLGLLTSKFVSLLQEAKDGVLDLKAVSAAGRARGGAALHKGPRAACPPARGPSGRGGAPGPSADSAPRCGRDKTAAAEPLPRPPLVAPVVGGDLRSAPDAGWPSREKRVFCHFHARPWERQQAVLFRGDARFAVGSRAGGLLGPQSDPAVPGGARRGAQRLEPGVVTCGKSSSAASFSKNRSLKNQPENKKR